MQERRRLPNNLSFPNLIFKDFACAESFLLYFLLSKKVDILINSIIQIVALGITFLIYEKIGIWLRSVFINGGILRYMRDDWSIRLPLHWSNNSYTGLSKIAFNFLCVLYYIFKEIVIIISFIIVKFYKLFLWDIWKLLFLFDEKQWYRKQIHTGFLKAKLRELYGKFCILFGLILISLSNNIDICVLYGLFTVVGIMLIAYSYEGQEVIESNIEIHEQEKYDEFLEIKSTNFNIEVHNKENDFNRKNSRINVLWHSNDETAWKKALQGYYESLSKKELELDLELEALTSKEIENYTVNQFYDFLYNKYFVWKYGYSQYLSTYLKSLSKYKNENRLSDLEKIKIKIFNLNLYDIEACIKNADDINGLGIAGASGLLSIIFPDYFGTVDQFVVKSLLKIDNLEEYDKLLKMKPNSLNKSDAVVLMKIIRKKAKELNEQFDTDFWTPRKIDMILWSIDRKR